jgi:hypothetical protein
MIQTCSKMTLCARAPLPPPLSSCHLHVGPTCKVIFYLQPWPPPPFCPELLLGLLRIRLPCPTCPRPRQCLARRRAHAQPARPCAALRRAPATGAMQWRWRSSVVSPSAHLLHLVVPLPRASSTLRPRSSPGGTRTWWIPRTRWSPRAAGPPAHATEPPRRCTQPHDRTRGDVEGDVVCSPTGHRCPRPVPACRYRLRAPLSPHAPSLIMARAPTCACRHESAQVLA